MATSINALFILLGAGIGIPAGVFGEKLRIKLHHMRKAMYLAWPMLKMMGIFTGGVVVITLLGLTYLGVW